MNSILLVLSQLNGLVLVVIELRFAGTASQGPSSENIPIKEELPKSHRKSFSLKFERSIFPREKGMSTHQDRH